MKNQNLQTEHTDGIDLYKKFLILLIVAITLAPLFALVPYVLKKANAQPSCEDLERDYVLAELNMKPDAEKLKQVFTAKCDKKPEVKQ